MFGSTTFFIYVLYINDVESYLILLAQMSVFLIEVIKLIADVLHHADKYKKFLHRKSKDKF